MAQRYIPYTGNFSTYGQGPEHRFFEPAESQPQVPQSAGLTAQTPSSSPVPAVQQQTNTPLFHPPAADSSFTGNIGYPNMHLAQPAIDANSGQAAAASAGNPSVAPGAAWSDPMQAQKGVDYSGSLDPQKGSTLGSTIGGITGRVAGSMIGSGLGPIGSMGLGYGLGKLGSYLGSNFDTPSYGGDSGMSDNGAGGFGASPGFGMEGAFGPQGGIGGGGGIAAGTDSLTGPGGMGGSFGGTSSDDGSDDGSGGARASAMGGGSETGGGSGGNLGGSYGGSDPTGGGGLGSPSSTGSLGSVGGDSAGGFGGGMGSFGSGGGGGGGSSGGSSRVICTELFRQGLIPTETWIADLIFTQRHISPTTVRGYQWWGVPAVLLMRRSPRFTRLMLVALARPRAEELAYRMGKRDRPNYYGKLVRWVMEPACWVIGTMVGQVDYDARLYGRR